MKKIFVLAATVSMIALSANAQYYHEPQYQTVQYKSAYQAQSQQQQYTPHAVCQSCYLQPYIGIDYSYNIFKFGKDEDGDPIDSYVQNKLHAGSVSLGMKVHDNFGVEAYYKKFAKAKKNNSTIFVVPVTTELELQSCGIDAVFYSPRFKYNDKISLIGTIGVAWYEMKVTMKAAGISESAKGDHFGGRVGIGLQNDINDHFAFRVMGRYNYTGIEEAEHMFELSAGIRYYF